jgi:hypothetical protein
MVETDRRRGITCGRSNHAAHAVDASNSGFCSGRSRWHAPAATVGPRVARANCSITVQRRRENTMRLFLIIVAGIVGAVLLLSIL